MPDPQLRRLIKTKKTAILPVGSLEQHGAHLPVSTDTDIATAISAQVAKKCGFMLLPAVWCGVSFEHAPFFNLSVSKATLKRFLFEICDSLGKNGIQRVIILNGHHGNQKALKDLQNLVEKKLKGRPKLFVISYWKFMQTEFDHAGLVETSLMLASTNKVNMKLAKKGLITDRMSQKQKARLAKVASVHFIKATKSGIWGDPTGATKEQGRVILSKTVKNIIKTLSKLT